VRIMQINRFLQIGSGRRSCLPADPSLNRKDVIDRYIPRRNVLRGMPLAGGRKTYEAICIACQPRLGERDDVARTRGDVYCPCVRREQFSCG